MKKLFKTSKGAALVEYGLLVGLIAVLAIVAVIGLGTTTRDTFCEVSDTIGEQIFGEAGDCLTAEGTGSGTGTPTPAPEVVDTRCLSPANINVVAGPDWNGCANMLIVDDAMLRAAAAPAAGGNGTFMVEGPDLLMYSFVDGPQTIYTGQVLNMSSLFSSTSFNGDITHWDTQSVTNMAVMFIYNSAFNQPIGDWNTSSLINASNMFTFASSFNQPLDNWDMSNATDFSSMFYGATNFNQNINSWDTSANTAFQNMFREAINYDQPLDNWDMSNARNIQTMFQNASSFNQPIGNWNMPLLDNNPEVAVAGAFRDAISFNQDLSGWCVPTVAFAGANFDTGAASWSQARPVWGTCP